MSDSSSTSSTSSSSVDLRMDEDWVGGRSRSLRPRSSVSSGSSADTPSRESVGAALDRYTAASREGRLAFSGGKLKAAVLEFDQALDIELQTELECLYDTSIGFVSGLVRREVECRLDKQGRTTLQADAKCGKILQQLRGHYEHGTAGLKGKRKDSPQWYMQMGAALVVINEWEKAKAIYTEGMSACKDKKELKAALKSLIKIEQMTSYADIPAEDQPDKKDSALAPASPLKVPVSPSRSPRIAKRDRATSLGWKLKEGHRRERTSSLTLDRESKASQYLLAVKPTQSPPITKKETKRLSINAFFNMRRRSSGTLTQAEEEMEEWSSCFEPAGCVVVGQTDFQPSAITHMRRLTSLGRQEGINTEETIEPNKLNLTFTPVHQQSLRIEDDDSELDDLDD